MTALNYGQEADDRGRAQVELEEFRCATSDIPPEDDHHADKLLRKVRWLKRDEAQVQATADAGVKEIHDWRDERLASLKAEREYLELLLAQYHRSVLARNPKATTLRLPSGEHKSRAMPIKFEVEDKAEFLAWAAAEKADALIRWTEPRPAEPQPDLKAFAAFLEVPPGTAEDVKVAPVDPETGVFVPGVSVVLQSRKFEAVTS